MQHVIVIGYADDLQLIDDLSPRRTTTAASYALARDYKVLDSRLFYSLQVQSRSDRLVKQLCTNKFLLVFKGAKRQSESSKAEAIYLYVMTFLSQRAPWPWM